MSAVRFFLAERAFLLVASGISGVFGFVIDSELDESFVIIDVARSGFVGSEIYFTKESRSKSSAC